MADDLNTQLVFGANTAGAEAGVRTVKRSLKDLADSAAAAGKSIEGAGDKAGQSLSGIADGGEAAARKLQRDTASMKSSLQRYLSTLEGGSKDSRKYWESMADFKGVDKNALRPLLDQLDAYKSKTVAASESTVTWSSNLTKIGAGVAGIAAVTASAGVAAKAMFDASASAERLRTMLDFSTGGNSAKEIEFLRGVTYRLGLEFTSTARAYGQFQAAAKGTALEGDKARGVFESVAKASAVMGLSAADTSGVLLALQQMISKGTVQAEELRGQLGERLPGAFQVAAKAMGVTTAELGKMLEQGQVVADDFLPKFGRALEENLGGAAEKAAQRLDAAVNRFDTAWEKLKQRAGDSGVSKAVAGELGAITRDLEAVTDGMDRAGRAGGGMWAQFGAAGAIAAGRVGFSTLNLAANSLNGAINALTGGVFGLRTDLALLPDVFKTDAQYAKALADRLAEAETKMAALQGTGASTTSNPYIRDSYYQLQEYIKELKKAQAEQAKLTGVPVVGVNEGIVAQGRAREAYNTQRAKDEEAAAAFRLNLAGVPASYVKEMQELIRLNQAGVIVGKEYTDALKKQQDELLKKTGAVKSSNAAANQEQNAYESLIASIRAKIEADNLEIAGGAALTESQRIRIKLDQDLAAGRVKLTAQNERAVRLALEELAASEASALAAKTLAKANLDAAASREKYLASLSTGLDKIKADTAAQLEATARMGLSKEAIADLDAAKLEMLATDLELQAIKAMDRNLDEQTYNALKQQAEAYRELAAAKKAGATKEMELDLVKANQDAAKKAADEWQRTSEKINDTLTDALMRGFESGKDFAKNLRDTVVNMFKTMVLRPVISAVVNPIAGAVTGALGLSSAASAATGGSAIGAIGTGASIYNAGTGLAGMAGGFANGLSAWGAGGSVTGVLSNPGLYTGAELAGALAPIVLGIGAIAAIAKSLDDSGTYHTGGAAQYSRGALRTSLGFRDNEEGLPSYNPNDNIDNQFGTGFGYVERGDQTISAVSAIAQGLGAALDGVAVAFGQKAGYEIATAFADDTSEDGAWGALRISREGQDLLNWENNRQSRWAPREFGDGEEGYKQYLAAVAKDTRQILLDMDLPSWADDMLESIGDSASMDQLTGVLTQIGVVQSAFVALGNSMAMFASLTDEMQSGLLGAAGSIEALTAGAGAFYQGFYSEQERIDAAVAQLNETLAGLDLSIDPRMGDDAKDQFRAAVEAAFAAGDAELAAALLAISGTFASAADYFASQAAEQLAIRADLERQILELQGDTAALRELDIAGMDAANVALYDRVQAFTAEQTAAQEATQALEQQASIRAGLERQLLEAQGDTAAIRDLERASLDESNRALFDSIAAVREKTAADAAAAQAAQAIAAERAGLERQLLQVQGDTAAIRALELAALDPTNQALQLHIYALQDEQAAAQAAAQAMDQVAQSIKSLSAQSASLKVELLRAQGNTAAANAAQYLIDTTGMTEAEKAIFDYNASLKAQIAALNDAAAAAQTAAEAAARAQEQAAQAAQAAIEKAAQAAERILSERTGLEGQLLTLQGNTAELRRRELATLDDSNRALQLQIWALEDQKTATEQATQAAESLASAWASISDSLMDEVKRIRGLMNDGAGQSLAALQSQFAIATAQARAGDQDAANSLTGLSRSLLESAAGQAATLADLQRLQAMTANSLEATAGMVGGTSASGGGVIVQAADNQGLMSRLTSPQDNSAALISEIRALREEVKGLRAEAQATAGHTSKTARLLDRVMPDGDALSIRTAL